jgi:hypothetical protein
MALERFRSHSNSTIDDAVRQVPARAKDFLKESFGVLMSLDSQKWPTVISTAAESFDSSYAGDEPEAATVLGVPSSEAKHLLNAASFVAAMLASHPECNAQEFVDVLVKHEMLDSDKRDHAVGFAELVAGRREGLTEELERSALKNEVLPSLQRLETTVDVRLAISDSGIVRAVPVVLMMIDTDAEGQIAWYQVSKQELKSMIGQLEKTLERVEIAEKWIAEKNNSQE